MTEDNKILYSPYSENLPKAQVEKINGLFIVWDRSGREVIDVRTLRDMPRLREYETEKQDCN